MPGITGRRSSFCTMNIGEEDEFDLYFYRRTPYAEPEKGFSGFINGVMGQSEEKSEDKEVLKSLSSYGNFSGPEITSDGFDAGYMNKRTGTHVVFSRHRKKIADREAAQSYPGYSYTGLSVILNYNRPHYLMYEAAPVIKAFCTRFDLLVYDPQDGDAPVSCTAHALIRSYDRANTSISNHTASGSGKMTVMVDDGIPLSSMSRDASHEFWEYMYQRNTIAEWMMDQDIELYAPEIKVLRDKNDGSLYRTVIITDGVGYLIPPCDAFLVDAQSKKSGFIRGDLIRKQLSDLLHPVTILGKEYLSLSIGDSKSVPSKIKNLPREDVSSYQAFPPGMWIDPE
jgi:hypothetical protein